MSCDLTTGRGKACYDAIGGIKAVFFSGEAMGDLTYDVTDTDVITTLGDAPEFFQYDLRGSANTFAEVPTKDVNNGTSFFAQTLTIQLPKLTKEMQKELKLLVYASPTVIIRTKADDYLIMGLANQADVTGGNFATGGASGDFAGYNLVLTAEETKPATFILNDGSPTLGVIEDTTATISAVQTSP